MPARPPSSPSNSRPTAHTPRSPISMAERGFFVRSLGTVAVTNGRGGTAAGDSMVPWAMHANVCDACGWHAVPRPQRRDAMVCAASKGIVPAATFPPSAGRRVRLASTPNGGSHHEREDQERCPRGPRRRGQDHARGGHAPPLGRHEPPGWPQGHQAHARLRPRGGEALLLHQACHGAHPVERCAPERD